MFFVITDRYIDYLSGKNPHVMSNKAGVRTYHRKYIGILAELGGFKYFVPLSSPKSADYDKSGAIKRDSLIKMYMRSKKVLYGTIRFNYMIPVPPEELQEFTVNDEGDLRYKILMQSELIFIRANRDKIEKSAARIYRMRKSYNKEKYGENKMMEMTLDFSELEALCSKWNNN